jgi:DNA repair photolyase
MNPAPKQTMIKITDVQAKSILNKSKIFDYCVNCYTGCQVNCRYCYAALFMRRYSGHSEPWGAFVDVKVNAPAVLEKQVLKAKKGVVWLSSVCDAYQPLEAKYKLTRRCLEILAAAGFPVQVQSKSVLLLRDMDVFKTFETIDVGFTITTIDEKIAKLFEPGASSVKDRIDALGVLKANGVRTFVFAGPLLPGNPEELAAALHGRADWVLIDRMNYVDTIKTFYLKYNLGDALSDAFFADQTRRLVTELKKRRMDFDIVWKNNPESSPETK